MTSSENWAFLDTNILVYAADELSPFHLACKELCNRGRKNELALCLAPQVLSSNNSILRLMPPEGHEYLVDKESGPLCSVV